MGGNVGRGADGTDGIVDGDVVGDVVGARWGRFPKRRGPGAV